MKRGPFADAGLGPHGTRNLAVLTLLAAARAAGLVLIAGSIADGIDVVASGRTDARAAIMLGALGVVLRAAASWASAVVSARAAAAAKLHWRGLLTARALEQGGGGERTAGGDAAVLATRGLDDLDAYYGIVLPAAVSAVVIPAVLGLRILSLDWLSAVIVAVTIPLIPVFMVLIGTHSRERADAAAGALARLADHLVELARGLPVLVGLGRVDEQATALDAVQQEYRARIRKTLRVALLSALALELIATLSVAVVAVSLGIRLLSGGVPLAVAIAVLLVAPECFGALRELGGAYHSAQDGLGALSRIRTRLGGVGRRVSTATEGAAGGVVRVDALTVHYPGRRGLALGPVDARLRPGEIVAITGASGAGKSTLLGALAGALPIEAELTGSIVGVPAALVGYAAQSPGFLASTVRAELALYADRGDGGNVDELLAELGLSGVADVPPVQLSPGEARRLAVARALARVDAGARMLLLDEPTAHLDDGNAELVRAAVRRRGAGIVVVIASHEPATLALADRLLPVDASRPNSAAPMSTEAPVSTTAPVSTAGRRAEQADDAQDSDARDSDARDSETPARAEPLPVSPRVGLRALALLRPGAARWVGASALGAVASGMALALTAVSGWLIVRASEQPEIMYLLVAIVGVRFFGIGRAVARYGERLASHDAVLGSIDALRLRLWSAIAARAAGSRRLQDGGTALDLLVTATAELREALPRIVTPLAVGALSIVGITVTVALIAPGAAPLVGGMLLLTLLVAVTAALLAGRRAERDRVAAGSAMTREFTALVRSADELRANGVADRAADQIDRIGRRRAASERRSALTAGLSLAIATAGTGLLAVTAPAFVGSAFTASAITATAAQASAETVAVVALLALAALEAISGAAVAAQRVPGLLSTVAPLDALLSATPRRLAGSGAVPDTVRSIRFDDLAVGWPGETLPVFSRLNARATRPEWLVIEGPSGSGKTTLLTALMGAIDVSGGRILLDGGDLAAMDPGAWRRRIAWCPQEAHVFDSSIRGNLLVARPRTAPVDDAEMTRVLRRVGLGRLLEQLPDGLGTRVGSGGRSLSGGERQRLAVARALLGDAEVLLLDEPTAHLDGPTARAMMDDIRRATRDRLVVLVSHRADDRREGDRVVRLSGRAVQTLDGLTEAPNTAAWVRRSMPSLASNPET